MNLFSKYSSYSYEEKSETLEGKLQSYKTQPVFNFNLNPFKYFGQPYNVQKEDKKYRFSGWMAITTIELNNQENKARVSTKSRITITPLVFLAFYALLPLSMLFVKNVTVNGNPSAPYYERIPIVLFFLVISLILFRVFIGIRNYFEQNIAKTLGLTKVENGTQHIK